MRFMIKVFQKLREITLFVYNVFILLQLCCIGYGETFRLKSIVRAMLNSVKTMRIKDRRQIQIELLSQSENMGAAG
jgi:hypothetical protein